MILAIVGLLIAIGLGFIIAKDINTPLRKMVQHAENLANFDLTLNYAVTRKDEFGETGGALVKAQENIKELVKAIMSNSQDMCASSEELSVTVEELLSKAEAIDEADSSINELSSKAMEGSNNASQSQERATAVKSNSQKAIA